MGLITLSSFRRPTPHTAVTAGPWSDSLQWVKQQERAERTTAQRHLVGAAARAYLKEPGEGQSLMDAITKAQFGLKSQLRGPSGETGSGYLGMSHVQNLNAWFAEDGVVVRPTVAEEKRQSAWHLKMQLKGYGYGNDLMAAPPIVSSHVKDNRIEYERAENFGLPMSNFEFRKDSLFNPTAEVRNRKFVEWYENRPEGIEQGFTIYERPEHPYQNGTMQSEGLRLVVQLNGELQARVKNGGQTIELIDSLSKPALSYGQLTAVDANGKQLAAHMETRANGSEIVLLVDDRNASYPIVVDPIVATVEKILDWTRQGGAQFGDAVAISGERAIVGYWLYDETPVMVDAGRVQIFRRDGTTWSDMAGLAGDGSAHGQCGYSVAISSTTAAFGCPGANGNTGIAFGYDVIANDGNSTELIPGSRTTGDFFGASVTTNGNKIVVGSPMAAFDSTHSHAGAISLFQDNIFVDALSATATNELFGTSLSLEGETLLVGSPGALSNTGEAFYISLFGGVFNFRSALTASDGAPGDQFGTGVAISNRTAIIGSPGDDDKGTDAGAAYVFVHDTADQWNQQQKLTASDGKANDIFGYNAVAIEGNLIVVGARRNDDVSSNLNDNRGAAYVFTRRGTAWTQQTKLGATPLQGAPGDEFGTSVGISGNTVISSAPHSAATDGTLNVGVSYIFRLDCVPPKFTFIEDSISGIPVSTLTICPGSSAQLGVVYDFVTSTAGTSFQWRKNGVNIPGATAGVLRIDNAAAADAGGYEVVVSNGCGDDISPVANIALHTFTLNPTSQNFGASGSNGVVNVTSTGSCAWTATSNSSFITVTSGATGSANGSVNFSVAANPTSSQRTGSITIAGKPFNVTQDGTTTQSSVVQFSNSNYSVIEDCTTVTINVNRSGDTSGAATVDYATSDVTASERRDYTTALGKLRFAPGETAKTFVVLISEDSYLEGTETFNVTLSNPSGATLGTSVATVQINDDPTEPLVNAIDDAQTSVGQHYHDFLNRQADASGLNFWTSQITSCGADQVCIELKRLNVSAAYFLSIEFQQTGYLVERVYKTAYGNRSGTSTFGGTHQLPVPIVRFQEFLRDTQRIGQGVVVGQAGWETALENNKQAFTAEFVQLSRFTSTFPNAMTAAQFVDALNVNAGGPLSVSERNQLVSDLSTNAKTREQILRTIAEHSNLVSSESNRAFVLMQYFGYLRRNPNDAPDADYTGYDFWLTKLNQFGGNFVDAEMVKAFITSIEYRSRFGQ